MLPVCLAPARLASRIQAARTPHSFNLGFKQSLGMGLTLMKRHSSAHALAARRSTAQSQQKPADSSNACRQWA